MLKVAFLVPSFPPNQSGGVITATYNLVNSLSKDSHYSIRVFTYCDTTGPEIDTFSKHNVEIVRSIISPTIRNIIKRLCNLIIRLFEGRKDGFQLSDIVISNIGMLKIRKTIYSWDPDIIIFPDQGVPILTYKKHSNEIVILISHHNAARFYNSKYYPNTSLLDIKIAVWIESIIQGKQDLVITPSKYMKDWYTSTYRYPTEKIIVIPNVVDYKYIRSIKKDTTIIGKSMIPIIYIPSGFSIYKGREYLVDIIKQISKSYKKEIHFYITGKIDTPTLNKIYNISPKVKIYCPGEIDYEKNISLIKSCQLCLSPTLIESYGMAILEAKICGLPTIYWSAGGNREIPLTSYDRLVRIGDIKNMTNYALKILNLSHKINIDNYVIKNYCYSSEVKYKTIISKLLERM